VATYSPSRRRWVDAAKPLILELLADQHAATQREIEARLAEPTEIVTGPTSPHIDPYHLDTALKELIDDGLAASTTGSTRGSSEEITTFHLPVGRGNKTRVERAAARKRLLTARHHSYARATSRHPKGLIGAAAENALNTALHEIQGYAPHSTGGADVRHVLGVDLRPHGGPIDHFATFSWSDDLGRVATVSCLFEIKNRRPWATPEEDQIHRFLYKAAQVQQQNPTTTILPVLLTRRRQHRLFEMARALGFFSIQYRAQMVRPVASVDRRHFEQVRHGLGYSDLVLTEDPNPSMRIALQESLPRYALETARRWTEVGCHFADHYRQIRDANDSPARSLLVAELKTALEAENFTVSQW
jgi:hypothetical protein